jgi:hypothetical protein
MADWITGSSGSKERRQVDRRKLDGEGRAGDAGRRSRRRGAAAAGFALVVATSFAWSPAAPAATYKWVDDKGVVHYSDKVPPEAVNKGSQELSKEGVPLRRTEPVPTPEQRRAREAEDERKRQLAKQQDEAERRDRALLASYTSEREIDLSRRRSLATIEAVIESATAYSEQLKKRKVAVEQQRAGYRDKPVPLVLEREYEGINTELAKQAELIGQKRAEWTATAARYDADRVRWRELSGLDRTAPATPAAPAAPATASSAPVATKSSTR